jgi:hypothetical protein
MDETCPETRLDTCIDIDTSQERVAAPDGHFDWITDARLDPKENTVGNKTNRPVSRLQASIRRHIPVGPRKEETERDRLESRFKVIMTIMIMLNAIFIGVEIEWKVQNPHQDTLPILRAIDIFFTSLFAVELLITIGFQRWRFVSLDTDEWKWNLFDFLMVVMSLVDELVLLASGASAGNASALRLLRLVRVMRIVRTIRFIKDLRMMINGILASMKSICWALLVLAMVIYIFTLTIAVALEALVTGEDGLEEEYVSYSDQLFLRCAICSCVSQGVSIGSMWLDHSQSLALYSPWCLHCTSRCLYFAFLMY